ncbi:MAG: mevalonate kinase, partial [Infirmifilum sp.]
RLEEISRMAYEAERIVHGRPSGIDNTIATYGGAIAYRKSEGFLRLNVDFKDVSLILADTGKPRSTGLLVKRVLDLYDAFPSVLEPIYYAAGRLAVEAAKMMERGDWEAVGALMNVNHGLLSAIGVSTIELEQIVYAAREAGALGAKLTGAGGGGYAVILCKRNHEGKIIEELRKVSPRLLKLNVENTGVSTSL